MAENHKYTIAYQGAPGAFSHLASQNFANSFLKKHAVTFAPKSSFEEAFEHASKEPGGLACIPFENSTIGSIIENYQLLWQSDLRIFSELALPIHHQLMALPGTRMEDIVDVFSHTVALDQCKRIFREHSWMHPQVYYDTGAAARLISEVKRKNAAAIAAKQAAEEYGLEIIAPDVEDFNQNCTRFALMGSRSLFPDISAAKLSLPFKLTIALDTASDLNDLSKITCLLGPAFRLAKIESLPVPEKPFQSRLFMDIIVESEQGRLLAESYFEHGSATACIGAKPYGSYRNSDKP